VVVNGVAKAYAMTDAHRVDDFIGGAAPAMTALQCTHIQRGRGEPARRARRALDARRGRRRGERDVAQFEKRRDARSRS